MKFFAAPIPTFRRKFFAAPISTFFAAPDSTDFGGFWAQGGCGFLALVYWLADQWRVACLWRGYIIVNRVTLVLCIVNRCFCVVILLHAVTRRATVYILNGGMESLGK